MAAELQGKRVAFLLTDGVEQIEYTQPRKAVEAAGAQAHLVSLKPGTIQGFNHLAKGDTFEVDVAVRDADPEVGGEGAEHPAEGSTGRAPHP